MRALLLLSIALSVLACGSEDGVASNAKHVSVGGSGGHAAPSGGSSSVNTGGKSASGGTPGSGGAGGSIEPSGGGSAGAGGTPIDPYSGPATSDVWKMGGVFVYDPKTFSADAWGPILKANHIGWVALQIVDGSTEKWACSAEPCASDTAKGFLRAWRPYVKWVGAWGVNRANSSESAVKAEAQVAVDLIDAYEASSAHVDFYIADAEAEYEYSKCGNCVSASDWWAGKFRENKPNLQAAVSSYGRTDLADVYWMSWKNRDFQFLPQAYWNDPNMASTFKPSACADVARVCPGSSLADSKGFNCSGSPTDCPCWSPDAVHPTIGLGWGQSPPTADDYIADLQTAHTSYGTTGFSIFEGQYLPPTNEAWSKLGSAIESSGIALAP